ncbi:MAG: hypothetical protein F4187_06545 [Gemmatimonadetes bacterium]|nr:hypothetical protein [Gemmatimonadota bacterium]MYI06140.1 hypothetical protein [Gemmatimonadota bacterium]
MDIRFIIAMMVIAMIMDFLGRMARKRRGLMPPDEDGAAEGADLLNALAGEEPEPVVRRQPVASGEQLYRAGPGLGPPPGGERLDPVRAAREAAREAVREAAGTLVAPIARPASEPPDEVAVPPSRSTFDEEETTIPGARTLELRDRAPREIEIRSREPRPLERRAAPEERVRAVPRPVARVAPDSSADSPDARLAEDSVGDRLGLGSAAALRRAVLVREVLGPPLALRDGGERDR